MRGNVDVGYVRKIGYMNKKVGNKGIKVSFRVEWKNYIRLNMMDIYKKREEVFNFILIFNICRIYIEIFLLDIKKF